MRIKRVVGGLGFVFVFVFIMGCGSTSIQKQSQKIASPQVERKWEDFENMPEPVAEEASWDVIKKVVDENVFTIDRGLKEYEDYFGPNFVHDLNELKRGDHWIDGGAGNAYAQKDFLGSRDGHRIIPNRPKLTAITFKYPANEPKTLDKGRFIVLSGRYFEDIPTSEIGPAKLITDVVGIINYTHQLDLVLQKYLELLKPNGKIYVFIPDRITFIKSHQRSIPLTEWLESIPGILIRPVQSKKSPYSSAFTFTIEKVGCGIQIPRLRLTRAIHPVLVVREFEVEPDSYLPVQERMP